MGNRNSSPPEKPADQSVHAGYYRQLYQELTTSDHAGDVADGKTFRVRMGVPYLLWGEVMYLFVNCKESTRC